MILGSKRQFSRGIYPSHFKMRDLGELIFVPLEPLKFGNRMAITCISKPAREQKSTRLNLAFSSVMGISVISIKVVLVYNLLP